MTENTQAAEATTTDISTLPPAERAMIVLSSTKTELQLREMVEETKAIIEIKDATGREQAHRAGMKLKSARVTIEKTGKGARDDATAFSRSVISEEKRLIAIVEAEEKRVLGLRDAFDAVLAAEKAAKEAAETVRKGAILAKIAGIRRLPLDLAGETAEGIAAERDALAAFEPSEEAFQEFTDECNAALADALAAIQALYDRTKAQEDAAAALAAEREALESERRAERDRAEEERKAIAEERAALAAERAAIAAQKVEAIIVAAAGVEIEPDPRFSGTHANGAPKFSKTTFKENGEPIMLNDDGTRSIFCDINDDYGPSDNDTGTSDQNLAEPTADTAPAAIETVAKSPAITDWKVRRAALATAEQFEALADKVDACGVPEFANQLRAVAYGLREGDHDARIAAADVAVMIEADNRLLDATVRAVDGFTEQEAA